MPYKDPEKQKAYLAKWHAENSDKRKSALDSRKAAVKAQIDELKSNTPCKDCLGMFSPWQMHFDHLPQYEKVENISQLISNKQFKKVWEEIEKCEIVCANCHADRTYRRIHAPKALR